MYLTVITNIALNEAINKKINFYTLANKPKLSFRKKKTTAIFYKPPLS